VRFRDARLSVEALEQGFGLACFLFTDDSEETARRGVAMEVPGTRRTGRNNVIYIKAITLGWFSLLMAT